MQQFDPYQKWFGIKPEEQPPNHYRLLGIDLYESDGDVILAAAEQRVTFLRNVSTGPRTELAQQVLNDVMAAQICLLDEERKAEYDTELKFADSRPDLISIKESEKDASRVTSSLFVLVVVVAVMGLLILLAVVIGQRLPGEDDQTTSNDGRKSEAKKKIVKDDDTAKSKVSIDLLSAIDAERDSVKGQWTFEGKTLVSPAVDLPKLQIKCPLKGEYKLTVVAHRPSGDNTFVIGLVVDERQVAVVLDGYYAKISGLELVNEKPIGHNETTFRQPVFTNGKPSTIVCKVQKNQIEVNCDGRPVIEWTGNSDKLSIPDVWAVPDRQALMLGTDGRKGRRYRISKIELAPL